MAYIYDVPPPVGPSGTQATPQLPLTTNRPTHSGKDNLATIDSTCEKHSQPLIQRIEMIETSLPRMTLTIEYSLSRIALVEKYAEKLDQIDTIDKTLDEVKKPIGNISSIETALKGFGYLRVAQDEMKETIQDISNSIVPNVNTLRTDDKHLMEETSTRRKTIGDQQVKHKYKTLRFKDLYLQRNASALQAVHGEPASQQTPVTGKHIRKTHSSKSKKKAMKPSLHSGTSRLQDDDSQTTSEDSDDPQFIIEIRADSTDDEKDSFVPFFKRGKGMKYPGLCSIAVSDKLYDKLMSYRYYRLFKTDQRRDAEATSKLTPLLKILELTFKEQKFSGTEPILVFHFLRRIFEESEMLSIAEGQIFVLLPHLLTGELSTQYRSTVKGSRSDVVTWWPEAVQYFYVLMQL